LPAGSHTLKLVCQGNGRINVDALKVINGSIKVEIGSGENSTCGSEPSHIVTREELADPKPRGYEFWFMAEARKRKPANHPRLSAVGLSGLEGDRFSQESANWFAAFLEVARKNYGLELEWIAAAQNEIGTDLNWIRKHLRPTLDARGFARVKLQAPDDDSEFWQMDSNTWRGSHVALRDPKTGDWSAVVVTGEKRRIQLRIAPGLKTGPVHVWKSTAAAQFIQQPPLSLDDNTIELELEHNAIYTFTSTTGQQKGSHGTPPARKPFPFPFEENSEGYRPCDTPRYFSDQKGTFEVYRWPKGGMCLAQIVPAHGILWFDHWPLKPHTLFGDTNWQDCVIEADVLLAGADAEIGGRYADRDKLGYRWILTRDGRWQLNWQYTTLAAGQVVKFNPSAWHHLRLELNGDQIIGLVDGEKQAAVTDKSRAKGMAFLASTYDRNLFDNVRVDRFPPKARPNKRP